MRLILLHGFTGAPQSWDGVLGLLPERPVLATPHLAGHGPRPVIVPDFASEVQRLCAWIEDQAEGPVHVAGYSMGARVALGMLAARPGLFSGATLIGARNGLVDPAARAERAGLEVGWIEHLERDGLDGFLDAWEALPMWASQAAVAPDRLADQRRLRASHTAQGLASAVRALGLAAMPDLTAALGKVALPVTLIAGELDGKFVRLGDELAATLPRARRLTVAGAGHNLLLERPEAVARALNSDVSND